MASSEKSPLKAASEGAMEVNEQLADTDGRICSMSITGRVGYHEYVAAGETEPEFLWKVAFLQALDDTVLEMVYVDAEDSVGAREQLERQLRDSFDPLTAEYLCDEFESNLEQLQENQADYEGGDL